MQTIAVLGNDSVTNAKLANMAQATIKGRQAGAGTGDPEDLTVAQIAAYIKSALGLAFGTTDNALLRADGAGNAATQGSAATIDDNGVPTFVMSGTSPALTLYNADGSTASGPDLLFNRGSPTAAPGDLLSHIMFGGANTTPSFALYANIYASILDATPGSEDGRLHLRAMTAGDPYATTFTIGPGAAVGSAADQGAGSLSAVALYSGNRLVEGAFCRGYVTYSGGTPTLVDSANVTSITDAGTGDLDVTIATDHANADFAALCAHEESGFSNVSRIDSTNRAAGTLGVRVSLLGSGTGADPVAINFATFGDAP